MLFLARIISLIASPPVIFIPASFLIIDSRVYDDVYSFKWTLFSSIFAFLLLLLVGIGVYFGVFTNLAVSKRKQRPLLFALSFLVLILYAISVLILNGPKILLFSSLFLAFSIAVLDVINMKVKASIHVAAVTAFVMVLGLIYGIIPFIFTVPTVFIIGWSRVKMGRHTKTEVLTGAALGLVLTIIFYILSKYLLI